MNAAQEKLGTEVLKESVQVLKSLAGVLDAWRQLLLAKAEVTLASKPPAQL